MATVVMDRIIGSYRVQSTDGELSVCDGLVYQTDLTPTVDYGADYFRHYQRLRLTPVARQLNAFRVGLAKHYCNSGLLDVGIGSGEFLDACGRLAKCGYDVNPLGAAWLRARGLWHDPYNGGGWPAWIDVATLWDVLEHMPAPTEFLDLVPAGVIVCATVPVVGSATAACVRASKHYKPGEHLTYWTHAGFCTWARDAGFRVLKVRRNECVAGRQDVRTFVLRRPSTGEQNGR